MEAATPRRMVSPDAGATSAVQLLSTLFAQDDLILFRPIETWSDESGRKQSRVDYKRTCYRRPPQVQRTVDELLRISAEERTNLFFGVCPRFGDKGRFDLAWQIRTVRVLWADIDDVTIEEALALVAKKPCRPDAARRPAADELRPLVDDLQVARARYGRSEVRAGE